MDRTRRRSTSIHVALNELSRSLMPCQKLDRILTCRDRPWQEFEPATQELFICIQFTKIIYFYVNVHSHLKRKWKGNVVQSVNTVAIVFIQ